MNWVLPVQLSLNGFILEPLTLAHADGLAEAAADGELWQLPITVIPEPGQEMDYIHQAINTPDRVAFAVIEESSGLVLGTTSYYNILPDVKRLEIGYTWYRKSYWRTALNTSCKWMLLVHAFETLGALTVGWRTDNLNTRSQAAIERLGAHKDGILRGDIRRKDGSIRDTVLYSMTLDEWPNVKEQLSRRMQSR